MPGSEPSRRLRIGVRFIEWGRKLVGRFRGDRRGAGAGAGVVAVAVPQGEGHGSFDHSDKEEGIYYLSDYALE